MEKLILSGFFVSLILFSCDSDSQNKEGELQEHKQTYIINNEEDTGKYGEGTYINTGTTRICQYCGARVHRDNVIHGYNGECLKTQSSDGNNGNQYSEGYDQGQKDAQNGLDSDPSRYGGNGQFDKGYEDGFNDY